MDTEQHILCLAARRQLTIDDTDLLLGLLQGPVHWERLWLLGQSHEVLSLLVRHLRQLQSQAPIPAAWMERADRRFYAILMHNTRLAEALLDVLDALGKASVEALPVKGVVLTRMLYGELGLRQCSDIDILVRPADLPAARHTLRALGFAHGAEPSFDDLHHPFHDPPYFRSDARGVLCVELHWALWDSHFFRLQPEQAWERTVETDLLGSQVRALAPEDMLLHLAIHRACSDLRLRLVCDISELLRRYSAMLDWAYLIEQVRLCHARTAMFSALDAAHKLLAAALPAGLLSDLAVGPLRCWLIERTCGAGALFRPAPHDDPAQGRHRTLRLLEQDDPGHMLQAFGYMLVRNHLRRRYARRRT